MQTSKIQVNIENTRRTLAATGAILKGSVSKVILGKRKRGHGDRVSHLLTYKGDGNVTKSIYIQKTQLATVATMLRNYQKAKQALQKLVELNVQQFKLTRAIKRIKRP